MSEPDAVVRAVADIAAGRPVVVVDGGDEGVLVFGPSSIGAGLRHGCVGATSGDDGVGDVAPVQILRDLGVRSVRRVDGLTAVAG